jgi:Fe-Mn family superoxide dismutase
VALGSAPPERSPVPLPFDPTALSGLSEKLLRLHHEKLYGGALKKLNEIRSKLGAVDPEKSGPIWSEYGALKAGEAAARNSVLLHELYFANLGGAGTAPPEALGTAIGARFGSLERFQQLVRGCGMSTMGWVLLVLDRLSTTLEIVQTDGYPGGAWQADALLVLDMFEHAYALDYGPNRSGYLDAFFRNLHWPEVGRRFDAAMSHP